MAEPLLKVENVSAHYGGIRALDGVSLHVDAGEIVAVLGANGAGKSTLLKCLSREMKISSGSITFDGKPLAPRSYNVVESGMVIVPEGRQIFYKLTVIDNLRIGACLRKDPAGVKEDLDRVYEMFPRLKERETQYGGTLSGGEQQMLAIARGIMARPRLILLDEPSLGLAPIIVTQIMEILQEINKTGTSIMLIEQNARKALKICSRAYLMNVGHIVREGTGTELLQNAGLTEAYLG